MITITINENGMQIGRSVCAELLHALAWLGLVPVAVVAGTFIIPLCLAPLVWLSPTVFGVLRTKDVVLDAALREVRFIDALGRDRTDLALCFDNIREIVVREVTDTDCPLFQVLLASELGMSELTAGGVPEEREAVLLCEAVAAFLTKEGATHIKTTRSAGKAIGLHRRPAPV